MISLPRIYGRKPVYLLLLSIFTLVREFSLLAIANASELAPNAVVLPTGPCYELAEKRDCPRATELLRRIASEHVSWVQRSVRDQHSGTSFQRMTYGALSVLASPAEFRAFLRTKFVFPGSTDLRFVRTLGERPRNLLPIDALRELGLDINSESAKIPDLLLTVVMNDPAMFVYLMQEFAIDADRVRDSNGNGLAHYVAKFANQHFLSSVGSYLPRQTAEHENGFGQTAADVLRDRMEGPHPARERSYEMISHWLTGEAPLIELALAG